MMVFVVKKSRLNINNHKMRYSSLIVNFFFIEYLT